MLQPDENTKRQFSVASLLVSLVSAAIALALFVSYSNFAAHRDSQSRYSEPSWPSEAPLFEKLAFCFLLFLIVSWPMHAFYRNLGLLTKPLPQVVSARGCTMAFLWFCILYFALMWMAVRSFMVR